ncbi:glycosyltransferase family 2 protein [Methylobacterium sp. ARG-1]|uniref:glycosyltransferase family 2 protein n=1 Tax=Methylobacterium sp. ARG-1 TaxID=1692501 RepID=UPI0009EB620B|nr:glycosyltransferase family 2 protein [Methylobacterium sp. ARG-1]
MALPLVSIIIPTLNRIELLIQTIRSVSLQNYANIELIISDNASRDGTKNAIPHLIDAKTKIIRRPFTLPLEVNVMEAAKEARGKYIMILSDDDLISSDYVSTMVGAFESDEKIQVGLGRRILIDGNTNILYRSDPLSDSSHSEFSEKWMTQYFQSQNAHNQINTIFSTFYRRSEWINSGGQPPLSGSFFADTIPFVGVSSTRSKVFYSPDALFLYRVHQKQEIQQPSLAGRQKFLGMFQFFQHLKPAMGDLSYSDGLRAAIIKYIISMFLGSSHEFTKDEAINPYVLYDTFWDYLSPNRTSSPNPTGLSDK